MLDKHSTTELDPQLHNILEILTFVEQEGKMSLKMHLTMNKIKLFNSLKMTGVLFC